MKKLNQKSGAKVLSAVLAALIMVALLPTQVIQPANAVGVTFSVMMRQLAAHPSTMTLAQNGWEVNSGMTGETVLAQGTGEYNYVSASKGYVFVALEQTGGSYEDWTINVNVQSEGNYNFGIQPYRAPNGCKSAVYIDRAYVGSVDCYRSSASASGGYSDMNSVYLNSGTHTVTFRKIPSSTSPGKSIYLQYLQFDAQDSLPVFTTLNTSVSATELEISESATLSASATMSDATNYYMGAPYEGARDENNYIEAVSSAPTIVSVSEDMGSITALASGEATITFTACIQGIIKTKTHTVTVAATDALASATLTLPKNSIALGESIYATASGELSSGTAADLSDDTAIVSYQSSNSEVASVDASSGKITAVSTGDAEITVSVTFGATPVTKTDTKSISVTAEPTGTATLSRVSASISNSSIYQGEEATLFITAGLSDGGEYSGNAPTIGNSSREISIELESLTPSVVAVDAQGRVSALSAGEGQIKVSATLDSVECESVVTLTVNAPTLVGAKLDFKTYAALGLVNPSDAKLMEHGWSVNTEMTGATIPTLSSSYYNFLSTMATVRLKQENGQDEDFTINVNIAGGNYDIAVQPYRSTSGCKAAIYIDGEYAGKCDFYRNPPSATGGVAILNSFLLDEGVHTITFRRIDDAASTGSFIYLNNIQFTPKEIEPTLSSLAASLSASRIAVGETALVQTSALMTTGEAYQFGAPFGVEEPGAKLTMISSNPDVATVDALTGTVSALSSGEVDITVTANVQGIEKTQVVHITVDGIEAVSELGNSPSVKVRYADCTNASLYIAAYNAQGQMLTVEIINALADGETYQIPAAITELAPARVTAMLLDNTTLKPYCTSGVFTA